MVLGARDWRAGGGLSLEPVGRQEHRATACEARKWSGAAEGERQRMAPFAMNLRHFFLPLGLAFTVLPFALADRPNLPGVGAPVEEMVKKNEIAGAVIV